MFDAEALAFDEFDRLHKSMRVSGHTTTTLGTALGVHRNTISNYLTGRSPMDRRTLIAWAFATGVPLPWLEHGAGGSGDLPPGTPGATPEYADGATRQYDYLAVAS